MAFVSNFFRNPRRHLFEPSLISLIINPFHLVRSSLFRIVAGHAPSFSGKILDIGCGSKPYESLFCHADEYIGMDIEVSGHDHSTSKVDIFYDGAVIPFDDGCFDTVVSFETFEHVFNLPELLKEVYRVLKPGGRLMISIPFCWPEHEQPYDFARYTSFGISKVLNDGKFDIELMEKSGDFTSAINQLIIEYIRAQFHTLGRCGQIFVHFFFLLPALIFGKTLSVFLPKRYEYYFGLVLIARKVEGEIIHQYRRPRNDPTSSRVIG